MALQQKIQTNLEKSLGNSLNIHLQQQMGSFQASMLEAFQSLREELTAKKQTEVDQTSCLASKPGTSSKTAVNLDLPPPRPSTNIQTEAMDVDYGPVLPPRLVLDQHESSDQYIAPSELPPKEVSMNLGSLLPNLKSTLIRVNTNQGPDMCHLLQGRISPL